MYITTRFQSSQHYTLICMLLVFMITVMVNYGIRNGPKNTNVHLQEWLEIVYWRQKGFFSFSFFFLFFFVLFFFFYSAPNPQKGVGEHKITIYCHGGMLLRQIFSILVFLFTHSFSSRTQNTYAFTQKKKKKGL